MLRFETPTLQHETAVWDYKRSFERAHSYLNGTCGLGRCASYAAWLERLTHIRVGEEPGFVRGETYLCFVGETLAGIFSLRFETAPDFPYAGHIGYSVLPTLRGQGICTEMLRHGLDLLRARGFTTARASALCENVASWRVMEKCGGKRLGIVADDGPSFLYAFALRG